VIEMLQRQQGATIAAIMKTTGRQQHSVRFFLAGVLRKRLGLGLVSEKAGAERVYRILVKKSPAQRQVDPQGGVTGMYGRAPDRYAIGRSVQTGAVTAMPPDQNAAAGLVDFNRNQGSGRRGKTSTEQECIFDRRHQPDFGAHSSG
jgi:Protein of unknown function (DUF3489)